MDSTKTRLNFLPLSPFTEIFPSSQSSQKRQRKCHILLSQVPKKRKAAASRRLYQNMELEVSADLLGEAWCLWATAGQVIYSRASVIIPDIFRGTGGGLRSSKRTTNLRTGSHFRLCASSRVSQAKCQMEKSKNTKTTTIVYYSGYVLLLYDQVAESEKLYCRISYHLPLPRRKASEYVSPIA